MKEITNELKIYELSKIWEEAAYNFAFWDKVDIDWDAEYKKALARVLETKDAYEYYRELMRFLALLGDGHTDVCFPNEIRQDPEFYSMFPILLSKLGDQFVLVHTSEALVDKVPLYSVLTKVDGTDIYDYLRKNCYPYFWHANEAACGLFAINSLVFGRRGSSAVLTFEKNGRQFEILLVREDPSKVAWRKPDGFSPAVSLREINRSEVHSVSVTEDRIAVIRISSFMDNSIIEKVYSCYDELKNAKGYIIDIRMNTGGNSGNGDAIAALFIQGEFRSCLAETQVYEPTYKAWANGREDFRGLSPDEADQKYAGDSENLKAFRNAKNIFYMRTGGEVVNDNAPGKLSGPIVVLMNEGTVSAAEDFVDVMKMYTDAVFIGNYTAGTSGQPLNVKLESGGSFRICTRRCIAQNGEDIYNKGFAPDIRLIPTIESLEKCRDIVFEKGLEVIREKIAQ